MLSYQHSYHAVNRADLHKHGALVRLLEVLRRKPRAITYMETHAGRGLYDLSSPEAQKTGEAKAGVEHTPPKGKYGEIVRAVRAEHGPNAYPGSPEIARRMLRDGDSLHLFELHPAENAALRRSLRGDNIHMHLRDGFEGALAISPPRPRKGLVLVDPSYEVKTEYAETARFAHKLVVKWPEAVVLIWYPVLEAKKHHELLEGLKLPHQKHETFFSGERALGSGLVCIGAPFGFTLTPE